LGLYIVKFDKFDKKSTVKFDKFDKKSTGKFDKKSTGLLCLIIQFAGLGALFGNLSPHKRHVETGLQQS